MQRTAGSRGSDGMPGPPGVRHSGLRPVNTREIATLLPEGMGHCSAILRWHSFELRNYTALALP
jgi:hypothetical protein